MEVREAIDEAADGGALEVLVAANDVRGEAEAARRKLMEATSRPRRLVELVGKIEGGPREGRRRGLSVAFGHRRATFRCCRVLCKQPPSCLRSTVGVPPM